LGKGPGRKSKSSFGNLGGGIRVTKETHNHKKNIPPAKRNGKGGEGGIGEVKKYWELEVNILNECRNSEDTLPKDEGKQTAWGERGKWVAHKKTFKSDKYPRLSTPL